MLKKTMTKPRTAAKRPARKITTLVQQNKAKRKRARKNPVSATRLANYAAEFRRKLGRAGKKTAAEVAEELMRAKRVAVHDRDQIKAYLLASRNPYLNPGNKKTEYFAAPTQYASLDAKKKADKVLEEKRRDGYIGYTSTYGNYGFSVTYWKDAQANPRGGKRSTVAGAKRLYKKFIGKAPHKITRTPTAHPAVARAKGGKLPVAKLATLSYLKVRNPAIKGGMIRFKGAERPKLLSHASGRQYYFQGGNQKLVGIPATRATVNKNPPAYSRAGLKAADVRTMLNLGEVEEIGYFERKKVENFRPVEYFHELGEENGKRPTLVYDAAHQQMHLVGGDYRTLWSGINN